MSLKVLEGVGQDSITSVVYHFLIPSLEGGLIILMSVVKPAHVFLSYVVIYLL